MLQVLVCMTITISGGERINLDCWGKESLNFAFEVQGRGKQCEVLRGTRVEEMIVMEKTVIEKRVVGS